MNTPICAPVVTWHLRAQLVGDPHFSPPTLDAHLAAIAAGDDWVLSMLVATVEQLDATWLNAVVDTALQAAGDDTVKWKYAGLLRAAANCDHLDTNLAVRIDQHRPGWLTAKTALRVLAGCDLDISDEQFKALITAFCPLGDDWDDTSTLDLDELGDVINRWLPHQPILDTLAWLNSAKLRHVAASHPATSTRTLGDLADTLACHIGRDDRQLQDTFNTILNHRNCAVSVLRSYAGRLDSFQHGTFTANQYATMARLVDSWEGTLGELLDTVNTLAT